MFVMSRNLVTVGMTGVDEDIVVDGHFWGIDCQVRVSIIDEVCLLCAMMEAVGIVNVEDVDHEEDGVL